MEQANPYRHGSVYIYESIGFNNVYYLEHVPMQVHSKRNDGCWGLLEHRLHAAGKVQEAHTFASQHGKWSRPSLATSEAQHDSIAPPLIHEAVTPVAFPITRISDAVPCWTTAATIAGTASRATALP
jgi:hypothetical protein